MNPNTNTQSTEQYLVTVVTRDELDQPSGIFDEEQGRELANEEAIRMMGYVITTRPEILPEEYSDFNRVLQPGSAYRVGDSRLVRYAVVGERPINRPIGDVDASGDQTKRQHSHGHSRHHRAVRARTH